ncbi:MAG: PD-(D/E)XK nuclease family protein, partial [Salinibacterium sp.]|nr:PD-(D/E)XK nuclease family protein [Salinibacterium sp.]
PRSEDAERGTVQLLTIHGAKGLEWEVVAVPRMTADELPAGSREGSGWVRFGQLPFEFRGDARELPRLQWELVTTQAEFDSGLKTFKVELAARHQAEERRLGYVAVTRAQDSLLLTGAFWGGQGKPRPPGVFLAELAEAGLIAELPAESAFEDNPLQGEAEIEQWPLEPLGDRRRFVERAASLVNSEIDGARPAGVWQRDLDLLLAERDAVALASAVVRLPERIPASRFKDFVTDPSGVARALRRPMPEKPYRATRLGTRFHGWVEARYGASSPSELVDAASGDLDFEQQGDDLDLVELERLQGIFERSRWATLRPVDVEIEIHLPFDGRIVICKIDAVYEVDDAEVDDAEVGDAHVDGQRFEIVDWKTGKAPSGSQDLEHKQLQLALYRLAYARFKGIDLSRIDAVFYYVSDDAIVRPERLFDEAELLAAWREATAPDGS